MTALAQREHIRVVRAALEGYGATDVRLEMGGRHPRLYFTHRGRERFYVVPGSLSDKRRGIENCLSDLRRMLGITNARPKSERPKPAYRKQVAHKAEAPALTLRTGPWAVLAVHPAVSAQQRAQIVDAAWRDFWRAHMRKACGVSQAWA